MASNEDKGSGGGGDANASWKGTVVFFSMDALGHINPILAIVKELRNRGYRAIILTPRPLGASSQRLRAQGFELDHCYEQESSISDEKSDRQLGAESSKSGEKALADIMQPLISNFRLGVAQAYEATYRIDGAVGKHLDDMMRAHDLIEAKMRSFKPCLIVCDHVMGVPCATYVAPRWVRVYSGFPSALYSSINDNYSAGLGLKFEQMTKEQKEFEHKSKGPLRDKIRKFFASQGATDWPLELDLTPTSPYLNFYLGPQELGLEKISELKPLPPVWHRLEHTITESDTTRVFQIPEKIAHLPGKLIYFSLGTLVTCDTKLINRLLEILSKSPNKFIVSMGQMFQHIRLYPNMWGDKFIDQKAVLQAADLFITHGGHNSLLEAFYFGVPGLIVLPVFADQFDSAQRVDDCGFGIRLSPYHCTQDELLGAIDSLLTNAELRENMRKISSRLRSIKYHEMAANQLEQLIMETNSGDQN